MSILILRRSDLPRKHNHLDSDKLNLYHFMVAPENVGRIELAVFIEGGRIRVLKAKDWPYGKPMSAAELLKYIAEHAA